MAEAALTKVTTSTGRELVPLEHDTEATFKTTRGAFTVPAEAIEEGGRVLSVILARGLPDRDVGVTILPVYTTLKSGDVVVSWRRIEARVRRL